RATTPASPDRGPGGIGVVDLGARRLTRTIAVGDDPVELALTRDGARLAISDEDAATATLVRTADGRVIATVRVGREPEGITLGPEGRVFYVTSEVDGTIDEIDARTGRPLHRFGVP